MKVKGLRNTKIKHANYVETVWYMDVTGYAKHIFGDILKKAEIALHYDENDIGEARKEAEKYIKELEKGDQLCINFDTRKMLITFKNNRQIEIWSSEWGSISVPCTNET